MARYKIVSFELGREKRWPQILSFAFSLNGFLGHHPDKSAIGIAFGHYGIDYGKRSTRLVLQAKTGDGLIEVLYSSKLGLRLGLGGILKVYFNGKYHGSVNFFSNGEINDEGGKTIGSAKYEWGRGVVANINGMEFVAPSALLIDRVFRLVQPTDNLKKLSEKEKKILVGLAFCYHAVSRGNPSPG